MAYLRVSAVVLMLAGHFLAVNAAPFTDRSPENPTDTKLEDLTELLQQQDLIDQLYAEEYTNVDGTPAEKVQVKGGVPLRGKEKAGLEPVEATGVEANTGESMSRVQEVVNEEALGAADAGRMEEAGSDDTKSASVEDTAADKRPASGATATGVKSVSVNAVFKETISLNYGLNNGETDRTVSEAVLNDNQIGDRGRVFDFMKARLRENVEQESGEQGIRDLAEGEEESKTVSTGEEAESDAGKQADKWPQIDKIDHGQSESLINSHEAGSRPILPGDATDNAGMTAITQKETDQVKASGNSPLSKIDRMSESSGNEAGTKDLDAATKTTDESPDPASASDVDIKEDDGAGRPIEKTETALETDHLKEQKGSSGKALNVVLEAVGDDDPAAEEANKEVVLAEADETKAQHDADLTNVDLDADAGLYMEGVEPGNVNMKIVPQEEDPAQTAEVKTGREGDSTVPVNDAGHGMSVTGGANNNEKLSGSTQEHVAPVESKNKESGPMGEELNQSKEPAKVAVDMNLEKQDPRPMEQQIVPAETAQVQDIQAVDSAGEGEPDVVGKDDADVQADAVMATNKKPEEGQFSKWPPDVGSQRDDEQPKQSKFEFNSNIRGRDREDGAAGVKGLNDHDIVVQLVQVFEKMNRVLDQSLTFDEFKDGLHVKAKEISDTEQTDQVAPEFDKPSSMNEKADQNPQMESLKNGELTGASLESKLVESEEEPNAALVAGSDNFKMREPENAHEETVEVEEVHVDAQYFSSKTKGIDNVEVEEGVAQSDKLEEIHGAESVKASLAVEAGKPQQLVAGRQGSEEGQQVAEDEGVTADKTSDNGIKLNEISKDTTSGNLEKTGARDASAFELESQGKLDDGTIKSVAKEEDNADGRVTETEEALSSKNGNMQDAVSAPVMADKVDSNENRVEEAGNGKEEEIPLVGNEEKGTNSELPSERLSGVKTEGGEDKEVSNLGPEEQLDAVPAEDAKQANHVQVDGIVAAEEASDATDPVSPKVGDVSDTDLPIEPSGGDENDENKEGALHTDTKDEKTVNDQTTGDSQSEESVEFAECNMHAITRADTQQVAGQLVFKQKKSSGVTDVWATIHGLGMGEAKLYSAGIRELGGTGSGCGDGQSTPIDLNSYSLLWNSLVDALGDTGLDMTGRFLATWSTDTLELVGEDSIIGRTIVVHAHSKDGGQRSTDAQGTILACCTVARASDVTPEI